MIREEVSARGLIEMYAAGQRHFVALELPDRSVLYRSELVGSTFETCFLSDIDFRFANLRGVIFKDCNLKCSDFRRADLSNSVFDGSVIESASFKDAMLEGAEFSKAYYHSHMLGAERPDDWDHDQFPVDAPPRSE